MRERDTWLGAHTASEVSRASLRNNRPLVSWILELDALDVHEETEQEVEYWDDNDDGDDDGTTMRQWARKRKTIGKTETRGYRKRQ